MVKIIEMKLDITISSKNHFVIDVVVDENVAFAGLCVISGTGSYPKVGPNCLAIFSYGWHLARRFATYKKPRGKPCVSIA